MGCRWRKSSHVSEMTVLLSAIFRRWTDILPSANTNTHPLHLKTPKHVVLFPNHPVLNPLPADIWRQMGKISDSKPKGTIIPTGGLPHSRARTTSEGSPVASYLPILERLV